MRLFIGIDPGQQGGIGILDQDNRYFAARRWNRRDPRQLYILLQSINDLVVLVYLENINMPPSGEGIENRWSAGSNLLVNSGIWQGWLMALGLPLVLVPPATWQAAHGLYQWKSRLAKDPDSPTPMTVARGEWPDAPLEFQADDGMAVGLLLAALAFSDASNGIDRAALQAKAAVKKQMKRRAARDAAKATRALPGLTGGADHGFF